MGRAGAVGRAGAGPRAGSGGGARGGLLPELVQQCGDPARVVVLRTTEWTPVRLAKPLSTRPGPTSRQPPTGCAATAPSTSTHRTGPAS
ncbi:hypothetical protein HEP87_64025 [Streptomyces sp. S1D4-11]|nr:hypothetical protein [Streptomyces sp. S1D4-11]